MYFSRVPKVHEATKVKLVSVAPMASKDIEDSQAIQAPQAPPWVHPLLQALPYCMTDEGLRAEHFPSLNNKLEDMKQELKSLFEIMG